uniref:Signal recognition particle 19 kDa protein n=1 Tax=Gasterosteus aculeatus aculeatus TaxID=481459 RepID=A0AAQ4Q162_GASAC
RDVYQNGACARARASEFCRSHKPTQVYERRTKERDLNWTPAWEHLGGFRQTTSLVLVDLAFAKTGDRPTSARRFICVYPIYINSKKTLAEGRRIPAEKAVENPSCAEIRDVLMAAGLNVYVENKMHPREWNRDVQFRGRVRVQVKEEDGSFCMDKFTSRREVMFYVAEMIPKLKTRTQKSGGGDASAQQGEGGKKSKKKKK